MNIVDLRDEIRDIYLDTNELDIRGGVDSDGSGKKYEWIEVDSSQLQDAKVLQLLKDFICDEIRSTFDTILGVDK